MSSGDVHTTCSRTDCHLIIAREETTVVASLPTTSWAHSNADAAKLSPIGPTTATLWLLGHCGSSSLSIFHNPAYSETS